MGGVSAPPGSNSLPRASISPLPPTCADGNDRLTGNGDVGPNIAHGRNASTMNEKVVEKRLIMAALQC
jgi:hypothetical protein